MNTSGEEKKKITCLRPGYKALIPPGLADTN